MSFSFKLVMKRGTIESFFIKKSSNLIPDKDEPRNEMTTLSHHDDVDEINETMTTTSRKCEAMPEPDKSCPINDIGLYVGKSVDDALKFKLLTDSWIPDNTFCWPHTTRVNKGKLEKRFLRQEHLQKFPFLSYSMHLNGLLCRLCVLFSSNTGKSHQNAGMLVTSALDKFDDINSTHGPVVKHQNCDYHKMSVLKANEFQRCFKNPKDNICNILDTARRLQIKENRARLVPIIKCIIFLGRQGLAFRGHRDDGELRLTDDDSSNQSIVSQEGNFRALLKFRVESGDEQLASHLQDCSQNATFISKATQNDLISSCGFVILNKILQDLKQSQYFSVLADETTDNSHAEQLSLSIRYVKDNLVTEQFLKFVHVTDLTGVGLATTILEELRELQVNLNYMVGQGYDGAAAMSGQFKGVQAEIGRLYPAAIYVHCAAHTLNLVITRSSTVQAIRNAFGIIGKVCVFINSSAKRVETLRRFILADDHSQRKQRLVTLCDTRWVERHDAVLTFRLLFGPICKSLEEFSSWPDCDTASSANMMLNSIQKSEFLVSLVIMERVLGLTLCVSKALQNVNIDLISALDMVKNVREIIEKWRDDSEKIFGEIFSDAEKLACKIDVDIDVPRIAGRQINRPNMPFANAEEYYRRSIFNHYLDFFISELKSRFESHQQVVSSLMSLIPTLIDHFNFEKLSPAIKLYSEFIDDNNLKGEYELWQQMWHNKDKVDLPSNVLDALHYCNKEFFPNIYKLLQIFATLPITTSSSERSFSKLKLLKSYLRSTMTESRLTGLALMNIHKDIDINVDLVIDHFAAQKRRKLDFLLS